MNWPEPLDDMLVDDTLGVAGEVAGGGLDGAVLVWARAGRATPIATRAVAINCLDISNLLGEATLGERR
jgi:hypothetical protein